jgi:hypothetical protein
MPAPSQALATLRPDLSSSFEQYDLDASRRGFVGTKLLTIVDVPTQAGNFGIIPIEQLLMMRQTQRAPGAGYNRGQYTFKPGTYSVKENGAEDVVDDREAKMYVNYFSAEAVAAKRARDAVLRNYESRVVPLLTSTGTIGNTGVAVSWNTIATSDPVTDASTAALAIYAAIGLYPDTCVMTVKKFWNCRRSANLISQIKFSGLDDPKLPLDVATNLIAQAFGVKRVLVAGGQTNSANEGQSVSLSAIWPQGSIGFYVTTDSEDFKEPCIGRTFHWSEDGSSIGGTVESYREEKVRGTVIRCRQDTDEQILYAGAGYLMTGADA